MKKSLIIALGLLVFFGPVFSQVRITRPETILPLKTLQDIIGEASGELALQNEISLFAANRDRLPEEYVTSYYEVDFIMKKLKEYGIVNAEVIDLPTSSPTTWDAEMAELWMTKPDLRKLADIKEIRLSLCEGSVSADTIAELVYVGPGNWESCYQGKEVKGKIVLVNGRPDRAKRLAVDKFGALGLIGYASSHPEFDPDEVGWAELHVSEKETPTFAFMVSTRQGQELRDLLERGTRIEVRAVAKTQMVPYKEQMVSAILPGTEYPEEELVFSAHLFEGFTYQGANDNASGCVAILETARALKKLLDDKKISPLRRSVRFLFVPEYSGTAAYIKKYPAVVKRFFANINEDMVGEALLKNNGYFGLELTPWSLPTYLNDVLAALIEWVGINQRIIYERLGKPVLIVSPTGTRDPFYYALDSFIGGSDNEVFVDGGVKVPAVSMTVWPDMWYHSSGDTPDKSDSTQLKRVVVISVAAAVLLANAGSTETLKFINETTARGLARLGTDKLKAEKMIVEAEAKDIQMSYKEALNIVSVSFDREREALASIRFLTKGDVAIENHLQARTKRLDGLEPAYLQEVDETFALRCLKENVKPQKLSLSQDEVRLSKRVPVRTEKMRGYFNDWEFGKKLGEIKEMPPYQLGRAGFEVRNFIDGKRSILDIRNAVSAEYGPLSLKSVEGYILVLEKTGFVKIQDK